MADPAGLAYERSEAGVDGKVSRDGKVLRQRNRTVEARALDESPATRKRWRKPRLKQSGDKRAARRGPGDRRLRPSNRLEAQEKRSHEPDAERSWIRRIGKDEAGRRKISPERRRHRCKPTPRRIGQFRKSPGGAGPPRGEGTAKKGALPGATPAGAKPGRGNVPPRRLNRIWDSGGWWRHRPPFRVWTDARYAPAREGTFR
jgi:hypothetical protein